MHRNQPRQWYRVMALAREARARCLWHAHIDKGQHPHWPSPSGIIFRGYRPSMPQWMALYTIAESEHPVIVSLNTVPGASIDWKVLGPLVREGLVSVRHEPAPEPSRPRPDRYVELTDLGRERTERGW